MENQFTENQSSQHQFTEDQPPEHQLVQRPRFTRIIAITLLIILVVGLISLIGILVSATILVNRPIAIIYYNNNTNISDPNIFSHMEIGNLSVRNIGTCYANLSIDFTTNLTHIFKDVSSDGQMCYNDTSGNKIVPYIGLEYISNNRIIREKYQFGAQSCWQNGTCLLIKTITNLNASTSYYANAYIFYKGFEYKSFGSQYFTTPNLYFLNMTVGINITLDNDVMLYTNITYNYKNYDITYVYYCFYLENMSNNIIKKYCYGKNYNTLTKHDILSSSILYLLSDTNYGLIVGVSFNRNYLCQYNSTKLQFILP